VKRRLVLLLFKRVCIAFLQGAALGAMFGAAVVLVFWVVFLSLYAELLK